jgi:hypothetical protein
LQQSISRPGSSLGQPINNYSSHHRDVQFLQPANTTTVLRERSMSPNSNVNIEHSLLNVEWRKDGCGELKKITFLLSKICHHIIDE